MKKIKMNAEGNKIFLEKLKNINLVCVLLFDMQEEICIHCIDTRGQGIHSLYSYLKGLDESEKKYIVISDVPIDYCCRCFDKEAISNIYIAREVLSFNDIYCLNGKLIQIDDEIQKSFIKPRYEEFYKEYFKLEQIVSECPCDCIYLEKREDKLYIVKEGPNVYTPIELLVSNILYAILSLQRFYGSKKYFDEICNPLFNNTGNQYFCTGHGERKDLYVKPLFENELKLVSAFKYPYEK